MLTTLRQIVEGVTQAASLHDAMRVLVSQTRSAMQVDCCSVYLVDSQRRRYRLVATEGLAQSAVGKVALPFDEGLVGLVGRREELINLADAPSHPNFKYLPEVAEDEFNSFLGVPIMQQRQVLGVLVVQQRDSRQFDEGDESFMVTLAAQLAARVIHAEMKGMLHQEEPQLHRTLRGVGASGGVAIARAWVWQPKMDLQQVTMRKCDDPELQLELFNQAMLQVQMDLDAMALRFRESVSQDSMAIFEIYQHLLSDPAYLQQIEEAIFQEQWSAASAVRRTSERFIEQFASMSDAYLRERALDVRDVAQRLLSRLVHSQIDEFDFDEPVVLLAEEVTASLLAEVPRERLVAMISLRGAVNSHASILARAMGIPAVMGLELPLAELDHRLLVVDGTSGEVIIEPAPAVLDEYRQLMVQAKEFNDLVNTESHLPAETLDGERMSVLLNAGLNMDSESAVRDMADGIGLYRTEIPFMLHDSFPSEQEQTSRYREILTHYRDRPVCMRTLDIGGDKPLPYFPIVEDNPFLGWRGIRLTLDHPELFLAQLKAMLRASEHHDNLSIMLPMISSLAEMQAARRLLDQAWLEISEELGRKGSCIRYPMLGAMIEVPAILYILPEMAPYVDFWSVGSNDLTQYLLAVDRNNARVAGLYDAFHPAVIRVLQQLVQEANAQGKPLSICGELAGDPLGVLILMAMGYRRFSMNLNNIARIKYVIRRTRLTELTALLELGLKQNDSAALKGLFAGYLEQIGLSGLLPRQASAKKGG
ncbi:MAG: phosphoenolpyruvate--protein phosphotransferase [Aeromonadaceae bacterium]